MCLNIIYIYILHIYTCFYNIYIYIVGLVGANQLATAMYRDLLPIVSIGVGAFKDYNQRGAF